MRRIINLLLGVMVFGPWTVAAQETQALSLQQCIDYAITHSAAAKNARLDVELQKAQNSEVTGRALPQISGEGKYTQFFDVQQAFLPGSFISPSMSGEWVPVAFSPKLSNIGSINATQMLFNGSLFVALQARNTLIEMAQHTADMKVEDLRYNIMKAYSGLIITHRQMNVMESSLQIMRKNTNDQRITYQTGLIEKLDVDRMEVQLSNLESDSIGLSNMILINEQMLKYIIGMDMNTSIVLTDSAIFNNTDEATALLMRDEAYTSRLNYQVSLTSLKLQQYDLKRYRFEGLPSLSAFGGAGYNRSSDKISDLVNKPYPGFSMIGLQLNVPIFDGMQRRSRVKAAKIKVEKAENDLENTKLAIDQQTKTAKITLSSALQTVESRKRTLGVASTVVDLTSRKYKQGVGSNLDVVQAQNDYLNAQNNYFSALQNLFTVQADLQKSLGLLK